MTRKRSTSWAIAIVAAVFPAAATAAPAGLADPAASPAPAALAATGPSREYVVKAAFIFNFAQFVEWPAEAFETEDAPLVIGVLGENPFGDALARAVQNKTARGHPLVVRHFPDVASLRGCHLLYTGATDGETVRQLVAKVGTSPVLTLGEPGSFLAAGGTMRFLMDEGKVRFEVNLDAAAAARLRISSKLLKLARVYRKDK